MTTNQQDFLIQLGALLRVVVRIRHVKDVPAVRYRTTTTVDPRRAYDEICEISRKS